MKSTLHRQGVCSKWLLIPAQTQIQTLDDREIALTMASNDEALVQGFLTVEIKDNKEVIEPENGKYHTVGCRSLIATISQFFSRNTLYTTHGYSRMVTE